MWRSALPQSRPAQTGAAQNLSRVFQLPGCRPRPGLLKSAGWSLAATPNRGRRRGRVSLHALGLHANRKRDFQCNSVLGPIVRNFGSFEEPQRMHHYEWGAHRDRKFLPPSRRLLLSPATRRSRRQSSSTKPLPPPYAHFRDRVFAAQDATLGGCTESTETAFRVGAVRPSFSRLPDDQGLHRTGRSSLVNRRAAAQTVGMTMTSQTDTWKPGHGADTRHPSDLARRVAHRRTELGISVEELAQRAGIDPNYMKYFERSADARLSFGSLNLVALVLDTNPAELLGAEFDRPPGRGRAGQHPSLESLTMRQCEAHLAAGGVGRVVFTTERGPVALPVNFEFTEGQIVLSTDVKKAALLETLPAVAFEVDRVDDAMSEGWSVVVSGRARLVDDPEELLRLSSLGLEPWTGGNRHSLICITPTETTGRVIVHDSAPDKD
jgi:Pyridoxamine 5'-phosphate oxidase/Helix-turn-helix domain